MSKALKRVNLAIRDNEQRLEQLIIKSQLRQAEEDKERSLLSQEEETLRKLKAAIEDDIEAQEANTSEAEPKPIGIRPVHDRFCNNPNF